MDTTIVSGWIIDFEEKNFYYGDLVILGEEIIEVRETGDRRLTWEERGEMDRIILPGLIDAHVHIESSMLMPSRFAAAAARFGTIATVSDPHEIANVMGLEGIRYLAADAEQACIGIHFTAPSCVPATRLETAGARLEAEDLEVLVRNREVVALGEVMNYPGVIFHDPLLIAKINLARENGLPVDGHAPGLRGVNLREYIRVGIQTDHECTTLKEAEEKIGAGMMILIREGSSARNFDNLYPLIDRYPWQVMLCTDDLHPDDLVNGHIDRLIRRGVEKGVDFFNLYSAASLNPKSFYRLPEGWLYPDEQADFVIAGSLDPFRVVATYRKGKPVFIEGEVQGELPEIVPVNNFHAEPVSPSELELKGPSGRYRVIRAYDGQLVTGSETVELEAFEGTLLPDPGKDLLKLVVVNRYRPEKPAIAWISGFGLKTGALASSIAHDSHNIIAVGTCDEELAAAINRVIENRGGIAVSNGELQEILPLPVAGLIGTGTAEEVGSGYARLTRLAREMGSTLQAPFMTLSFMALLVIPHLKLGDRGLFDGDKFDFVTIQAD